MMDNQKLINVKEYLKGLYDNMVDGEKSPTEVLEELSFNNDLITIFGVDFLDEYIKGDQVDLTEYEFIELDGKVVNKLDNSKWYEIANIYVNGIELRNVRKGYVELFVEILKDQIYIY